VFAEAAWQKGCELSDDFMLNHYSLCLLYSRLDRDEECRIKREEIYTKNGKAFVPIRSPWIDESLDALHQELVKKAKLI
jgi:hypothetical protein